MKKIIVNGGKALCGEVRVSGSKNAALPLIFASLLIDGETTLHKVPDIGDVRVALELLSGFGAEMIITACPLCLYNLAHNGNGMPVYYFTELLAEALGVK